MLGCRITRFAAFCDHVRVRLDRLDAIKRKLQPGLVEPETRPKPNRRKER